MGLFGMTTESYFRYNIWFLRDVRCVNKFITLPSICATLYTFVTIITYEVSQNFS